MLRKFPEPADLPKTGGNAESFPVEAYVADISYDMMLSYEWLAKHRPTTVPHLGCLPRLGDGACRHGHAGARYVGES